MKLLDLLNENLGTNGTDYSAVRKSIVKKLQDSANELDTLVTAYRQDRKTTMVAKNLELLKKGLESDATVLAYGERIYPLPGEEGMFQEINKGYRLEPTGFDPEMNKYSSRVVKTPITRLVDQLTETFKDVDPVIKTYPEHKDKFKDLKSDLGALIKELKNFSKENKLE